MSKRNIMIFFMTHLNATDGKVILRHHTHILSSGKVEDDIQTSEAPVWEVCDELSSKGEFLNTIYCFTTAVMNKPVSIRELVKIEGKKENEEVVVTDDITQFDFICKHMRQRRPEALQNTRIVPIEYQYDEDTDLVKESNEKVVVMAKKILDDIRDNGRSGNALDDCHLYADSTGGFRHATMMMTAVMEILQYSGIHLEKFIYSDLMYGRKTPNRIYDFSDINRMYLLVSGADAFVKYGRSDALEEYFQRRGKSISKELSQLLSAMHQLSDVLLICQTEKVQPCLTNLSDALARFHYTEHEDAQEALFAQLLDTIEKEYFELTKPDENRLDIIRWCVDKKLYQQAITFAVEWLPDYFVEHHLCEPSVVVKNSGLHRNSNVEFITTTILSLHKPVKTEASATEIFNAAVRSCEGPMFRALLKKEGIDEGRFDALVETIDNLNTSLEMMKRVIKKKEETFRLNYNDDISKSVNKLYPGAFLQEHPVLSALLRLTYYLQRTDNQSYIRFLQNATKESILIVLRDGVIERCFDHDEFYKLIQAMQAIKQKNKGKNQKKSREEKWQERALYWRDAMKCGVVRYNKKASISDIVEMLRRYDVILRNRNIINHAGEDKSVLSEESAEKRIESTIKMIYDCLDKIEEIERK